MGTFATVLGEQIFLDVLASLDLKLSVSESVSNSPFSDFQIIPVIPVNQANPANPANPANQANQDY